MHGKIAFEEHFNLPQFEVPRFEGDAQAMAEVDRRLADVNKQRLADMDATGIDYAILSLVSPDIQSETDARQAVSGAKKVNDTLAEVMATHEPRYGQPIAAASPDQRLHKLGMERRRLRAQRPVLLAVAGKRRRNRG
jgi:predicted TIM-barrel fold metal-dependent hydrolase